MGVGEVISIQNVTKYYGPVLAIRNVSFEVKKGEILGFLGPNGAGKTTTMRIITGYFPPTDGDVYVENYSILDNPLEVKRKIGYVPENPSMYNDMVVKEYIRFIGAIKGIPKTRLSSQVDYVIERCALEEVVKKRIGELSKGYRQRVALAQALVNDPPVLILDEPTSGLDPKQIYEIRQFIRSMAGERTIILSTHILPEVSVTCSKVVIINEGRIVASGLTEEIGENLMKSRQIELRVSGDTDKVKEAISKVKGIKGIYKTDELYTVDVEKGTEIRAELARAIVNSGLDLLEMKSKAYSLEEVFLKLVTEEEGGAKG